MGSELNGTDRCGSGDFASAGLPAQTGLPATRARAVLAGMWRGAKFGFLAFLAIMAVIWAVGWVVVLCVPRLREIASNDRPALHDVWTMVWGLPFCATVFGALPGAIIMGINAGLRWRRPCPPQESRPSA
jgi:uncharacterized RDD family membrane protein YckC